MPAVNKPINLEPTEAQAANMSAPSMVASAAAQAPTNAGSTAAATCDAARSMWAPLAQIAAEDETMRQALNAGGERRIASIYQRQTEAVTTLVNADDENRQSLTLLPGGSEAI
jgi:hypothetical protein